MSEKLTLNTSNEIARITFTNEKEFNSIDLEMMKEFANYMISLGHSKDLKGIIITGTGRAFSTGGNLKWASGYDGGPAAALHGLSSYFHQGIIEIKKMNLPVVAAINGIAAGGGFSLVLACDFRIMSDKAILKQGYTSNGLSFDGGGSFALPKLVGLSKALEVVAFDEPINAEKALEMGLVNKVVSSESLLKESEKFILKINENSLTSFGLSKRLLYNSYSTPFETQLENERAGLIECAKGKDGQEGIKAFLEKRRGEFNR